MDGDSDLTSRVFRSLRRRFFDVFPALEAPNFRLFLSGQAISLVGTWMQGPVMSWVVYDITKSTAALGWVSFLGQLPMTFLVIAAGVVADRYSRQRIVTVTQTFLMLSAFALAALAATDRLTIKWIYLVSFLTGIAQAFDVPARQAFIVQVAGRKHLGNAIALNSAMFNTARIIGPSVGGIVLRYAGAALCFFINGVSFLAIILALIAMRGIKFAQSLSRAKGHRELIDGLRYVRRHRDIFTILILTAIFSLFGTYYMTLLPAFARDVYHKSAQEYGLLVSSLGVGALVGAVFMATTSKWARQDRWMLVGLALMSVTLTALSFVRNYGLACLFLGMHGFGQLTFLISGNTLVQHLADERYQGRTMAARHFFWGGLMPFGGWIAGHLPALPLARPLAHVPLFGGWLEANAPDRLGVRGTVLAGAVILLVTLITFAPRVLRIDMTLLQSPELAPRAPD